MRKPNNVIPAKAGTHNSLMRRLWVPAFAGMTTLALASTIFADTPPPKKKKKLKWLQDLSAGADSSSNRSATVAGVRGLEEVGAAPDTAARDFKAIDRLDRIE